MVVSDLVIVALDQLFPKKPKNDEVSIQSNNRNCFFSFKQYCNNYFVFQALRGIWYYIYPRKERIYTDAFCDLSIDEKSNRLRVHLRECWIDTVCCLIKYYVATSPHHLIGIMFRIDYPDKEVIHSARSLDEYLEDLLNDKVNFDELYFVTI